jgi:hypothetical protein
LKISDWAEAAPACFCYPDLAVFEQCPNFNQFVIEIFENGGEVKITIIEIFDDSTEEKSTWTESMTPSCYLIFVTRVAEKLGVRILPQGFSDLL